MDKTTEQADREYLASQAPEQPMDFVPQQDPQNPNFSLSPVQNQVIKNYGESLNLTEPETTTGETVSFTDDGSVEPPSPRAVKVRAVKAAYGTKQDSKELEATISAGAEVSARKTAATLEDMEWSARKNKILRSIVESTKGQVTSEELDILNSMSSEDFGNNWKTVFEKKFAQKYIKDRMVESAVEAPTGMFGSAYRYDAGNLVKHANDAVNKFTRADLVNNFVHEVDTEKSKRGWIQTGAGIAWNLIGTMTGVSWYNQTRVLGEAAWSGVSLPGTIKAEQLGYIWSIRDPVQFDRTVRDTYNKLKEVSFEQAVEFAHHLKGFGNSDQFLMNLDGALLVGMLPWGKVGSRVLNTADKLRAANAGTPPPTPPITTFVGGKEAYAVSRDKAPPIPEVQQDFFRQGTLFDNLPEQFKPPMEPGQLRATHRPIAQQLEEESIASQTKSGYIPAGERVKGKFQKGQTGRFEKGQEQYWQDEFDFTFKGGDGYNQRGKFKSTDETYNTRGGNVVDARTGKIVDEGVLPNKTMITTKLDEAIDRQIAFAGFNKTVTEFTDNFVNKGIARTPEQQKAVGTELYGSMERHTGAWESAPMKPADMLPTYTNPSSFFANASAFVASKAAAVAEATARGQLFEEAWSRALRIRRIPEAVEKQLADELGQKLINTNSPKWSSGIIDAVHLPSSLFKSNTGQAVLRLGDPRTREAFTSRSQAELFAKDHYKLAPGDHQIYISPDGKYYIGLRANIVENSDRSFNLISDLKTNVVVGGGLLKDMTSLLLKGRMNDAWMAKDSMAQRKVAEHAQQALKDVIKTQADFFRKMGKTEALQVEKTLNVFGNQRRWYDTAEDFAREFQFQHKFPPSPAQVEAAFLYKQLSDYDFMIRNAGMYRDMARVGTERFALMLPGGISEHFNGIQLDKLPWGRGEDFTIALYRAGDKEAKVGYAHQAERLEGKLSKKDLDSLVAQKGFRVIQVFDPAGKPLNKMGLSDAHVNYIVTDVSDVKPLSWMQLKYEPGPHSIYPHEWYVKQAKVGTGHLGKTFYYGDNTLWNFSSKAEADMWHNRLEKARQLVQANDPSAEAYITKNLPYSSLKEFMKLKSQFDFEKPFSVTQRGYSVYETQKDLDDVYKGAINFHKSTHNPQNFMDRTFLQERDALLNNPAERAGILSFEQGKQLDAYEALNIGLNQSIRGMWLNDEKVRSATQWIENYAPVIDMRSIDDMRAIPMWTLYNANLKHTAPGSDLHNMKIAAEAEKAALVNFIGQQTEWGNAVSKLQTDVMNTIYTKGGKDMADFASQHSLSFIKDPARYFRTWAANPAIGMFNPIPMFQQAMIHAQISAIVPEHTLRATSAAYLIQATEHTGFLPTLDRAAKMAEKFGWKADHFKEMNEAYRSSGLNFVGKEATLRNDMADAHLVKLGSQVFGNKGFMFFNSGERGGRRAAFAAAYSEWRAANPTAKLTEETTAGIMQRADTLTGHMTAASQASWLSGGIPSVAAQFTTFFKHMAELMMGKELTPVEKIRLFAVNSTLYGVPAGLGIGGIQGGITSAITSSLNEGPGLRTTVGMGVAGTLGFGTPYDDIMEYARAKGYKMDNMFIQAFMKGLPNVIMQIATGADPDFNKKYGIGANNNIRDALRNDEGFFKVITGAAGGLYAEVLRGSLPFTTKVIDAFAGTGEFSRLQYSDFESLARTVGSWDYASRVAYAFAYQKHITKRGVEIGGLDTMDVVLTALKLDPKRWQEEILQRNVNKVQKESEKKFEDAALESYRKALTAYRDGDEAAEAAHMKDAAGYMKMGDFNPVRQSDIMRRAAQEAYGVEANTARRTRRMQPNSTLLKSLPEHFRNEP